MYQSVTCHSKFDWQTSHCSAIINQPSKLCLNFILQVFRLAIWFYCLFRIYFLVGYLLNKVHVVFDAFDSSCCSYVHKKFKNSKKKRPFGLGALGLQIISNYFQKIGLGALGLFSNFFSKTPFCSFKDYKIFPKPPLSKTPKFFQKPSFQENIRSI